MCIFQIFLKVAETGVDVDPEGGEGEPVEDPESGKLKPFFYLLIFTLV